MTDKNGNRKCDKCGRYVKEEITYGGYNIPPDTRFDETFCERCQSPVSGEIKEEKE